MNVVLWARVSSREQREGYSLDAQLRSCRSKAERSGWHVAREFVVAESAKRGAERQTFNEMLRWVKRHAKNQDIRAILSHKLDRACRNMRDAVRLQCLEDECGVRLAFVENEFGPGAAGALSFNVMAAVSQYYSDNLRTEVLKGMDERFRQGWPIGRLPFGYRPGSDDEDPVVLHEQKSRALRRIFDLFSSGSHNLESLSAQLAAEGYAYRSDQPRFKRTGLAHILNNRFYIGEMHRDGNVCRGAYQQIIDADTFERCQDILHGRNRRNVKCKGNLLFAGGLLTCRYCGMSMTGERIRRKLASGAIKEHIYYRCGNNNPPADHPKVRWREADIEAKMLAMFESIRFKDAEYAAWLRGAIEAALADQSSAEREKQRRLRKRQSELAAMQERLLNAFLQGSVSDEVYQAKSTTMTQERIQVERELEEEPSRPGADRVLRVFDESQNLAKAWQRSNSTARRAILESVSLNRLVDDVTIVVAKTKPFDLLSKMAEGEDGGRYWT